MPYSTGTIILLTGFAVVFVTFGYLVVNAPALMGQFRPMSDGEIVPGQGKETAPKSAVVLALILHFAGWAIAAFAGLALLAETLASTPDRSGAGAAGIVSGTGNETQRQ